MTFYGYGQVFVYSDKYALRLIAEFSLDEMRVEILDVTGRHALSSAEIEKITEVQINGQTWRKLWQRHESDERGGYTAVGFKLHD